MARLRISILAQRERAWAWRQLEIREARRRREAAAAKPPAAIEASDEDPLEEAEEEPTEAPPLPRGALSFKCANCGAAWCDVSGSRGDECVACGDTGVRLKAA